MPGFEIINKEEFINIKKIFKNNCILFKYGFENLRNNLFFVKSFENSFKNKINSKYALAVTSGTAALKIAVKSLNLKPGDKVLIPSFTFVATIEAVIECGLKPVICEIDNSLNMSISDLRTKIIKKNVKAIIVVHMLGYPADILNISKIAKSKKIHLIEDTAWGLGAKVKNKYLGTFGRMGTFSFDYAKSMTTGEGGMIIFKNKKDYEFASEYHDHGHMNVKSLPRFKDTRKIPGFNYRMNEIQGALGIAQLKKLSKIINYQRKFTINLKKLLSNHKNISFIKEPDKSLASYDSFCFFVNDKSTAIKIRNNLLKNAFSTKILPEAMKWHFADEWEHINFNKGKLIKSKKILDRTVSIPISMKYKKTDIKKISDIILNSM